MFGQTRNTFYRLARLLGDVQAIVRGTIVQRIVRKKLYGQAGGLINSIFKRR
jgi:hypothetical protein